MFVNDEEVGAHKTHGTEQEVTMDWGWRTYFGRALTKRRMKLNYLHVNTLFHSHPGLTMFVNDEEVGAHKIHGTEREVTMDWDRRTYFSRALTNMKDEIDLFTCKYFV